MQLPKCYYKNILNFLFNQKKVTIYFQKKRQGKKFSVIGPDSNMMSDNWIIVLIVAIRGFNTRILHYTVIMIWWAIKHIKEFYGLNINF